MHDQGTADHGNIAVTAADGEVDGALTGNGEMR
jgi:hypothetical protein